MIPCCYCKMTSIVKKKQDTMRMVKLTTGENYTLLLP